MLNIFKIFYFNRLLSDDVSDDVCGDVCGDTSSYIRSDTIVYKYLINVSQNTLTVDSDM